MSNFAALVQQMGQNLELQARPTVIEGVEFNKNGTKLQRVVLQDLTGATGKVKIYQGNNPPMNPAQCGQTLVFKLKAQIYKGQTYFSGFWQCPKPQEEPDYGQADAGYAVPPSGYQPSGYQPPQNSPPPAQNSPPAAPKPPAQNQAPQVDREAEKNASICRQCAGKCAAEIMTGLDISSLTPNQVLAYFSQLAEPMAAWFLTGDWRTVPVDEPEQEEDSGPDF